MEKPHAKGRHGRDTHKREGHVSELLEAAPGGHGGHRRRPRRRRHGAGPGDRRGRGAQRVREAREGAVQRAGRRRGRGGRRRGDAGTDLRERLSLMICLAAEACHLAARVRRRAGGNEQLSKPQRGRAPRCAVGRARAGPTAARTARAASAHAWREALPEQPRMAWCAMC